MTTTQTITRPEAPRPVDFVREHDRTCSCAAGRRQALDSIDGGISLPLAKRGAA
jgi:hypothetical protein